MHWILYGTLGTQRACCTPFTPNLILQPGACIFGPDPHALKSWATLCFLIDCFPETAQGSQIAWSYKTTIYACSPFDAAAKLILGERGFEAVKHFVQLHTYYYLLLHSLAHNLALTLEKLFSAQWAFSGLGQDFSKTMHENKVRKSQQVRVAEVFRDAGAYAS